KPRGRDLAAAGRPDSVGAPGVGPAVGDGTQFGGVQGRLNVSNDRKVVAPPAADPQDLDGAGASRDGRDAPGGDAADLSSVPFEDLVREQLRRLGLDPAQPPLVDTPRRVEEALRWLTRGYRTSVAEAIGDGVFVEEHDNMIMVRDIELYSMCEHHML